MKRIKKLMLFAVAAVMMFSFAACGETDTTAPSSLDEVETYLLAVSSESKNYFNIELTMSESNSVDGKNELSAQFAANKTESATTAYLMAKITSDSETTFDFEAFVEDTMLYGIINGEGKKSDIGTDFDETYYQIMDAFAVNEEGSNQGEYTVENILGMLPEDFEGYISSVTKKETDGKTVFTVNYDLEAVNDTLSSASIDGLGDNSYTGMLPSVTGVVYNEITFTVTVWDSGIKISLGYSATEDEVVSETKLNATISFETNGSVKAKPADVEYVED